MNRIAKSFSARSVTRLLVMSYFIALSLGLIGGTRMMEFMVPLLPDDLADTAMRGLVLTMSMLVLTGIGRRPAASILSLLVFFSSYTTLYAGGDISLFWQDLALIGAILMTADFTGPEDKEIDWNAVEVPEKPERVRSKPVNDAPNSGDDQPFREDLDLVRAN